MEQCIFRAKEKELIEGNDVFAMIREDFAKEREAFEAQYKKTGEYLEYAFNFLEAAFGSGQELVTFVTELNSSYYSMHFLQHYNCERYYQYNKSLLFVGSIRELLKKIDTLL